MSAGKLIFHATILWQEIFTFISNLYFDAWWQWYNLVVAGTGRSVDEDFQHTGYILNAVCAENTFFFSQPEMFNMFVLILF